MIQKAVLQQMMEQTARRFASREKQRKEKKKNRDTLGKGGDWRKIDDPMRTLRRLETLGRRKSFQRGNDNVLESRDGPDVSILERVMQTNELMSVSFLHRGSVVSRSVGRVVLCGPGGGTIGYGTGFMVSPRLLITNNHVLEDSNQAASSFVEFNYYRTAANRMSSPVTFRFQPDVFFITSRTLDFSLVAVDPTNGQGQSVSDFGWNPLISESGKALVSERVNIIQHPGGEPKQVALRQNEIIDVSDNYLLYVTDTERGSSGAMVCNDQWEVAALHHSGVPKKDEEDHILMIDGSRWNGEPCADHLVAWVANEGIRISKIVEHVKALPLTPPRRAMFARAMEARTHDELVVTAAGRQKVGSPAGPDSPTVEDDGSVSWYFRLNFGPAGGPSMIPPTRPATKSDVADAPTAPSVADTQDREDAQAIIDSYAGRTYYDPDADREDRDAYYPDDIDQLSGVDGYHVLHQLLRDSHIERPKYKSAKKLYLYPWIDLRKDMTLKSIYSGMDVDPLEMILADIEIERKLDTRLAEMMTEGISAEDREEALDLLEAQSPYNCEHVVCQSWYNKAEPMRGDLHHLFTCESNCNSYRSNIPYFDFPDFPSPEQESEREECGKREDDKFEPFEGKGAVARATLYFLLRYPELIGDECRELQRERFEILKDWHKKDAPSEYEYHRNAAIYEIQGNRNPLIDYPDLVDRIDFDPGFGG